MRRIQDARILIICTDGVEQLEVLELFDGLRKICKATTTRTSAGGKPAGGKRQYAIC